MLPPSVMPFVTGPKAWNFGIGDMVETGWISKPIPDDLQDEAKSAIRALDAFLEPVDCGWLAGRIATLLSHYWIKDTPAPVLDHVAGDWIDVLGEYPAQAIQDACIAWLKTSKWAPRPADIVELVEQSIGDAARQRARLLRCMAIEQGG